MERQHQLALERGTKRAENGAPPSGKYIPPSQRAAREAEISDKGSWRKTEPVDGPSKRSTDLDWMATRRQASAEVPPSPAEEPSRPRLNVKEGGWRERMKAKESTAAVSIESKTAPSQDVKTPQASSTTGSKYVPPSKRNR